MKSTYLAKSYCLKLLCLFSLFLSGCAKENKEQFVGRDSTWFPKQFGIYTSNINAFLNDLVAEVNRKEKTGMNIINQDWVHLFEHLDEAKTLGAFTTILPSLETESRYLFSDPILLTGPVLVVAEDSPFRSLGDLQGRLIGVYKFDSSAMLAQDVPNVMLKPYQHVPVALEALASHCYDALLAPVIEVSALIDTAYKGRLKIIDGPLNQEGLRLVALKGEGEDLIDSFNIGLAKLKRSGQYQAIKQRYRLP